jgi:hypothetical protein
VTTDPKLTGGPDRGSSLRALAALTDKRWPLFGGGMQEGLPTPRRIEFAATDVTLLFDTLEEASAWASKFDATSTSLRRPMGTRFVISHWTAQWRGWTLLISAVELVSDVTPDDINTLTEVLDVLAEDLTLTDDDLVALLEPQPQPAPEPQHWITRSGGGMVAVREKSPDLSAPASGRLLGFTEPMGRDTGWRAIWRDGQDRHQTQIASSALDAEALLFAGLGITDAGGAR